MTIILILFLLGYAIEELNLRDRDKMGLSDMLVLLVTAITVPILISITLHKCFKKYLKDES